MKQKDISRTSAGLRNALFDEIDRIRRGEGDPQQAIAVANLAKNIIAIAKLEYELSKDEKQNIPRSIELGDSAQGEEEEQRFIAPVDRKRLMAGR